VWWCGFWDKKSIETQYGAYVRDYCYWTWGKSRRTRIWAFANYSNVCVCYIFQSSYNGGNYIPREGEERLGRSFVEVC
jgi:hypothetical protein